MNSRIDSLSYAPQRPEPRNRAEKIINMAAGDYNFYRTRLKPDQSINLLCTVGGMKHYPNNISSPDIDIIEIRVQNDDTVIFITAPVEQVTFSTVISKKVDNSPPREIGFHTTMESKKQV